ncbi:MAG: sugar phosphate isomerase/epimerase family protein [Armatimonadota bacterium]|jgi:sugar phosphate isomerase/epimerase
MKVSVMSLCFQAAMDSGEMTLQDVITCCAHAGADGIELMDRHTRLGPVDELAARISDAGLAMSSLCLPCDFVHSDEAAMQQAVDAAVERMEVALSLGCNLLMLSPGGRKDGWDYEDIRASMARGMALLCGRARPYGVIVTTENHGGMAALRGRVEHLRGFKERAPDLMLTYDSGNFLLADEDPLGALHALLPWIVHVHLKDWRHASPRSAKTSGSLSGQRYEAILIGDGLVPTREIVRTLADEGYDGYLSIEYTRPDAPARMTQLVKRLADWGQTS